MSVHKRATIYFDAELHKALRLRAAVHGRSISDVVNEAVRAILTEDASDAEAFAKRKGERAIPFELFLRELKKRGSI